MSFKQVLVLALVSAGACTVNAGPGAGGGGGGSGSSASSNWTEMPLAAGHDSDSVTGIYFASPTQGFIASVGGVSSSAGAIFGANATTVTGIAYDGTTSNDLDFYGFAKTPTGYYAFTDIEQTVVGDSTGAFTNLGQNGSQGGNLAQVIGAYLSGSETVLVTEEAVWKAPSAPGANATYAATWAPPPANPTVPDVIPAEDCQDVPLPNDAVRKNMSTVAVSADGTTIAYVSASDADAVPQVCVSTNGGANFVRTELPGTNVAPSGIVFPNPASPSTMIVYNAQTINAPSANFIMRSTDAGKTFTPVAIPASVPASIEFDDAFFAPDGLHGWILGFQEAADLGLALVTTDGGQTWTEDTTGLASVDPANEQRLRAGFALDATHVWIGGDNGVLFAYRPQ
jgi:hypothetical protein